MHNTSLDFKEKVNNGLFLSRVSPNTKIIKSIIMNNLFKNLGKKDFENQKWGNKTSCN